MHPMQSIYDCDCDAGNCWPVKSKLSSNPGFSEFTPTKFQNSTPALALDFMITYCTIVCNY